MAVCVPRDATVSATYLKETRWMTATSVDNLAAVDDSEGDNFYVDADVGYVVVVGSVKLVDGFIISRKNLENLKKKILTRLEKGSISTSRASASPR